MSTESGREKEWWSFVIIAVCIVQSMMIAALAMSIGDIRMRMSIMEARQMLMLEEGGRERKLP